MREISSREITMWTLWSSLFFFINSAAQPEFIIGFRIWADSEVHVDYLIQISLK